MKHEIVEAGAPARRCAVYTRKSTSAGLEKDFNSLDAQREACEAFIKSQPGWKTVDARYDDGGYTGANLDRPAFKRLLADIEAGKIDVVVCYKIDRVSRSLLDFLDLMRRFERQGTALVSITQNFSTADAMGRLVLHMLASFAEFERAMIAERTRDKISAARRKGKWTGGPTPYGYRLVGGKLTVDDREAEIVRVIFDGYRRERSFVRLIDQLTEAGQTRRDGLWTKDALLRVLKNPVYAGRIRGGSETYVGEHTAIVEPEGFDEVQAMFGQAEHFLKRRSPSYLLRGIARCGTCGEALTPASTKKGMRRYRYYRCDTRSKRGSGSCTGKNMPARLLEDAVVARLGEAVSDPRAASDYQRTVSTRVGDERAALEKERVDLPKEIARLAGEVRGLLATVERTDGAARRVADRHLGDVSNALEAKEKRLAIVEERLAVLREVTVHAEWVAHTLEQLPRLWESLTPANRERLVQALVERVVIDAGDRVMIQLVAPWAESVGETS